MRSLRRQAPLYVVAFLLWAVGASHPIQFLSARESTRERRDASVDERRFVDLLSNSTALRERLKNQTVVGYVSDGPIDVRVGGPLQQFYYLSQFALAPVLLDHEGDIDDDIKDAGAPEYTLAFFRSPARLDTFLAEHSHLVVTSIAPNLALTRSRND